ncbi:transcription termination factor Rho, partial [Acidithiobacillus ferridurans]|nr:transcription termination factor Rho [Acidithiobacillus ferridurans]
MNLTDLKRKTAADLAVICQDMGLEGTARQKKQEIIFNILKAHARNGDAIYGEGVLEILQDGFGFLRAASGSYMAG